MRAFGKASDFYRLRILAVEEDRGLRIEWHDEILYRRPRPAKLKTKTFYLVQAVALDTDNAYELRRFSTKPAAERYLKRASELLGELTKSQFEHRFKRGFGPHSPLFHV